MDALHPIQAKARGMEAENLAKEFKDDLIFIGGIDTQELLPWGTPEQVRNEVKKVKGVFGEHFVVSPSHEALLANVSLENVLAMRDENRKEFILSPIENVIVKVRAVTGGKVEFSQTKDGVIIDLQKVNTDTESVIIELTFEDELEKSIGVRWPG